MRSSTDLSETEVKREHCECLTRIKSVNDIRHEDN